MLFCLFSLYFKRRRQRDEFSKDEEAIDHKVLSEAEAKVKDMNLEMEFLKHYVPIHKFESLHGYDETSMTNIVYKLKEKDIAADYLFQQTLPVGKFSYNGRTGTYRLFVDKNKVEEAEKALQKILA